MYNMLRHAHSGLRWIVLALLIAAIYSAYQKWVAKDGTEAKQPFLFNLIAVHIQTVIGLILYFISPKVQHVEGMMANASLRFYGLEHIVIMLLAAVLVTIGYSKAKRQAPPQRYKTYLIFNAIALLIILVAIPWPFRAGLGGSWF